MRFILKPYSRLGYACPRNYNPADFFIRTLASSPGHEDASKQTVRTICNEFAVSDYAKEVNVIVQYEFHMGRASEVTRQFWKTLWYNSFFSTRASSSGTTCE